jgi:hypothetical protein
MKRSIQIRLYGFSEITANFSSDEENTVKNSKSPGQTINHSRSKLFDFQILMSLSA